MRNVHWHSLFKRKEIELAKSGGSAARARDGGGVIITSESVGLVFVVVFGRQDRREVIFDFCRERNAADPR